MQIFDGHNDALLRLWSGGREGAADRFAKTDKGHIDVERARIGGFAGGMFAMFAPPEGAFTLPDFSPPYDFPLPPMLDQKTAWEAIDGQATIFGDLDAVGGLKRCTSHADIDAAMSEGQIAAVLHLEGAEAIGPELEELDLLYARGLRSLGLVWSRPTIFGHGVPFRYPSDGNIGPGLTDAGKSLVARCKSLGVMVDNSHLNVAGFWDVADIGVPLVATHSNAHVISPGARNLTDEQLRAIGQTNGMVGLNFGTMFLREDGRIAPEGGLEVAIRHLAHMVELAGEDHVGLGSDFDGAPMPDGLASAAELPNLINAMRAADFGETLIKKLAHENWLAHLKRQLG